MKVCAIKTAAVLLLAASVLWLSGCGSSNVNQIVDTVSPASTTVVADTTQVFTSTVTGPTTNFNSTWTCTYVYTPAPTQTTPNPTTTAAQDCTSGQTVNGGSIGTWTSNQTTANNTLSYTAPSANKFPNPIPTITFTAAAAANTGKKGTAVVSLDTGIRIAVTPTSATAPVGVTPAQTVSFSATLASGPPLNLNWKVMQPVVGSSSAICNAFPSLVSGGSCGSASPNGASCSPSCGSIDSTTGVFTAPATMPTVTSPVDSGSSLDATNAPVVTVVVWVSGDIFHFAAATITLVNASTNPITFTGIHPTTIAAGGILQDVWLDARNLLTTTSITFTSPLGQSTPIDPTASVFNIPITQAYCKPSTTAPVVTCDASIVTRIRLNAAQLAVAGTGAITVNNIPNVNGQASNVSFPINLVYASPAIVGAVPDSYPQSTSTDFSVDGGYYGGGSSPIVKLLFDNNLNLANTFGPRQFTGSLQGGTASPISAPGLYQVSIQSSAPISAPPPFNPPPFPAVTTNVAVQPTFTLLNTQLFGSGTPPVLGVPGTPTNPQTQIIFPPKIALPAGAGANPAPSSIAINSDKGYAVITEQLSNSIQLINFAPSGTRFVPTMVGGPIPVGNQPTGIAIDPNAYNGDDLGVVVNSADSTLTLLDLTPTTAKSVGTVNLTGLIQEPPGTTTPLPYSVGVDPITHYALVAFSNATLGFIVYVNPNPPSTHPPCFASGQNPPCAIASVSLSTGANPQIVMQPNAPLAYVTPGASSSGGSINGVTSVVSMLLNDNQVAIAPSSTTSTNGASCPAGTQIATITTNTPNGLNQSSPGAVLIQGVTPSYFNGTYPVLSASNFTFQYELTCPVSGSSTPTTGGGGTVTFGNAYYTFATTTTAVGAAINPVTRTLAFADPNSSTTQVGFIRTLDQTVSSLSISLGSCTNSAFPCTPNPSNASETGIRSVAWDPYTNLLIAYDPYPTNQISLINPGGPTASGTQIAYRIIQAIGTNQQGCYTAANATPCTVYGAMAYDPKTNLVLVANAGSNTLTYLDLDPGSTFKPVAIRDIQVTSNGVPSSQPPLASTPGAPSPLPVAACVPSNPINPYDSCIPHGVQLIPPGTANPATTQVTIVGQGFGSSPTVRLDQDPTGVTVTAATDSSISVTIDPSRLGVPHDYALDVVTGSTANPSNVSNTNDLYVIGVIDLSKTCASADMPEAVAYDDIRHVALVTNYGCNNVSIINMDSTKTFNYPVPYGNVMSTVTVGANPLGVAVIPRLGYAVTANNGDSSASIINISNPLSPTTLSFTSASCTLSSGTVNSTNICVGISPTGAAIDQDRALAIIANTGGNSVSTIDLTPLLQTTTADCAGASCVPINQLVATSGPPTAIAIDPNRAVAVVTNIQNSGTSSVAGGLDVIALSSTPPTKSSTASINTITANPTGIVYDPAVTQPCTTPGTCGLNLAPALFYVSSTQENAIYSFNPDSGTTTQIRVGVNPYSLGYNYQTGTLFSINSTSNTASIIDTVNSASSVFTTRDTLGFGSQSQFALAVDNFTNTAIIADQNNNRVLILALPK